MSTSEPKKIELVNTVDYHINPQDTQAAILSDVTEIATTNLLSSTWTLGERINAMGIHGIPPRLTDTALYLNGVRSYVPVELARANHESIASSSTAMQSTLYISDEADLNSFAYSLTNKLGCIQLPVATYNLARVAEVCGIGEITRSMETVSRPPAFNNTAYELPPLDTSEKRSTTESGPVTHLRRTREAYSAEMAVAVNKKHSLESTLRSQSELHHQPESILAMVEGIKDSIVEGLMNVEKQIAYDTICLFAGTSPATEKNAPIIVHPEAMSVFTRGHGELSRIADDIINRFRPGGAGAAGASEYENSDEWTELRTHIGNTTSIMTSWLSDSLHTSQWRASDILDLIPRREDVPHTFSSLAQNAVNESMDLTFAPNSDVVANILPKPPAPEATALYEHLLIEHTEDDEGGDEKGREAVEKVLDYYARRFQKPKYAREMVELIATAIYGIMVAQAIEQKELKAQDKARLAQTDVEHGIKGTEERIEDLKKKISDTDELISTLAPTSTTGSSGADPIDTPLRTPITIRGASGMSLSHLDCDGTRETDMDEPRGRASYLSKTDTKLNWLSNYLTRTRRQILEMTATSGVTQHTSLVPLDQLPSQLIKGLVGVMGELQKMDLIVEKIIANTARKLSGPAANEYKLAVQQYAADILDSYVMGSVEKTIQFIPFPIVKLWSVLSINARNNMNAITEELFRSKFSGITLRVISGRPCYQPLLQVLWQNARRMKSLGLKYSVQPAVLAILKVVRTLPRNQHYDESVSFRAFVEQAHLRLQKYPYEELTKDCEGEEAQDPSDAKPNWTQGYFRKLVDAISDEERRLSAMEGIAQSRVHAATDVDYGPREEWARGSSSQHEGSTYSHGYYGPSQRSQPNFAEDHQANRSGPRQTRWGNQRVERTTHVNYTEARPMKQKLICFRHLVGLGGCSYGADCSQEHVTSIPANDRERIVNALRRYRREMVVDPKKAAKLGLKQSDFGANMTFADNTVKKVMKASRSAGGARKELMTTRKAPNRDHGGRNESHQTGQTVDDLRVQVMAIEDPKERATVALNMLGLQPNDL